MAALWYEGSCRFLWRFYSGDSHSPDDKTLGKVSESPERRRGDGCKPCVEKLRKSPTLHIIYCLVQYMEYWIHGFPTGSSVKTSWLLASNKGGWFFDSLIPLTITCSVGSLPLGDPYCAQARLTTRVQILGLARAFCNVLRHRTLPRLWHAWKRCTSALYMCGGSTVALHGHDV